MPNDEDRIRDEERVWVVDREWRVPSHFARCRRVTSYGRCQNAPVADLQRARSGSSGSWWAYCPEHLYGRRIRDGHVELAVHPDSPAAQRGWVD